MEFGEIQPTSSFLEDLSVNKSAQRQALTQGDNEGKESWDKYRKRETVNRAVTDANGTRGPGYRAQLRKTTQTQPARDPLTDGCKDRSCRFTGLSNLLHPDPAAGDGEQRMETQRPVCQ